MAGCPAPGTRRSRDGRPEGRSRADNNTPTPIAQIAVAGRPGPFGDWLLAPEDSNMPYAVAYAGPDTAIIESAAGPFGTFAAAQAAAVEHVKEHQAGCRDALLTLRPRGVPAFRIAQMR